MSIARANCRFEFEKRSQLFVRAHNETLSVAAVRIDKQRWFARWNRSLRCSPNSNQLS